jgi:hypothetical protein
MVLGTSCAYTCYSSSFLSDVHSSIVDCTSLILSFFSRFLLIHSLRLIVDAFTCLLERFVCMVIVVAVTTPYHSIAWLSDSRWKKKKEREREGTCKLIFTRHTYIGEWSAVDHSRDRSDLTLSSSFKNDLSLSPFIFCAHYTKWIFDVNVCRV